MLGAGAPSSRFDALGHKLMCVCGCGQVLLECNHVGCPDSDRMITELRTELATGLPDEGVLNWFAVKYGPTVLAAPLRGGFDLVAWIVPFAALFLGLAAVAFFIRRWRRRQLRNEAAAAHAQAPPALDPELRDRIRQETTY
jgi:cytochrome c-type biogenesis protein CcmH